MSASSLCWSADRQLQLQAALTGFWSQDVWDMNRCPLSKVGVVGLPTLRFAELPLSLRAELKYACWQKYERKQWKIKVSATGQQACRINRILHWLHTTRTTCTSFLDKSILEWELSLRSYLVERGQLSQRTRRALDKQQQLRTYQLDDPHIYTFRQIYQIIQTAYDDRPEFTKDIWDPQKFGATSCPSKSPIKLNFSSLRPPWLQQATKEYLRYRLALNSVGDCAKKLDGMKAFSAFLSQVYPTIQASEITRRVLVEYLSYLSSCQLAVKTRLEYLCTLRDFFELCAREGWAELAGKPLLYDEDMPRLPKPAPRAIPQEVLDQLNRHLQLLPVVIQRMVLIVQECGMRLGELCTLRTNCLSRDAAGDWFLHYYQRKMTKDHSIPISSAVAEVIQAQQQDVRDHWGETTPFLFPTSQGQPIRQYGFVNALNQLGYKQDIRDSTGKLWRFQAHQFRHYVGTRMINNGVRQHFVQRYLGHESPAMTSTYARIHDQTLKEEFAKFRGKTIDVTGRVVEDLPTVTTAELQWLKQNIQAQVLPNGRCALPAAASACPHANACLTCVHFRTDRSFLPIHKAQLAETRQVIETAQANGWTRVVEMNERVAGNLERIIIALEPESV